MNKISSTQTNYTAPAAGYAEGTFKDDPGDASGSSIIVKNFNDLWYAVNAPILKYTSGLSDTDEKTTASDFEIAYERAIGIQNENVSAWASGTTYSQDDHAMYLGIMFVSMVNSNTGNNPIDNPDKWLTCFNRDEAIMKHRNCDAIQGGMEALHNHRDSAYRQYFKWGQYNYGGDSGRNFQAYGIHLDGTVVTGGPLATILDVGGPDEYPHIDIIAPDVAGTRTLLDTKGAVAASVDASGVAERGIVGSRQEDAMQRITGILDDETGSDVGYVRSGGNVSGVFSIGATVTANSLNNTTTDGRDLLFDSSNSTSPNTAKTSDTETRMKNYSVGVALVLAFVEI